MIYLGGARQLRLTEKMIIAKSCYQLVAKGSYDELRESFGISQKQKELSPV